MRASSLAVVSMIGCAGEEHIEDDDGPKPARPDDDEPDPADQEVCESGSWLDLDCPFGYGSLIFVGKKDLVFLDLEDVVQPVCGGRGRFVDADDLEGVDHAGYLITQNTACTFGCFAPCSSGSASICETDCQRVCGPIEEEHCIDIAQACDPDVACAE